MLIKKSVVGAVLLAAAAVSTTASADDRGMNTAVGAVLGAAIGAPLVLLGGALFLTAVWRNMRDKGAL